VFLAKNKLKELHIVALRLSNCSHSDYFNDVFNNFEAGKFQFLKKPMD